MRGTAEDYFERLAAVRIAVPEDAAAVPALRLDVADLPLRVLSRLLT